jgi:hypothetical protein
MTTEFYLSKIKEFDEKYGYHNEDYTGHYSFSSKHIFEALYGDIPNRFYEYRDYPPVIKAYAKRFMAEQRHDSFIQLYKDVDHKYLITDPFYYFINNNLIEFALKCHDNDDDKLYAIGEYYYNEENIEEAMKYFELVYESGKIRDDIPKDILQKFNLKYGKSNFYIFRELRKIEFELYTVISNQHLNFIILNYLYE